MANTITYGFVGLEHLWDQRVTTIGEKVVYDAIVESAMEHTRQLNALMASFVQQMTEHQIKFLLPGAGTLQPLDEYGNPRVTRPSGSYNVAFPIQGGGDAWGNNRITRALMTVEEANRHTYDALRRDADWISRHVRAAVLDNTTWTFDDPAFGDLTIQPLANGDTVTYVRTGGDIAVDTHQLAQAAAIDDSNNPFDTIYTELMEHPSNSGPVVVYVATGLTTSIESLTAFVPVGDPDINYSITTDQRAGNLESIRGFGDEVLGKVSKCWIVEWKALPAGYMVAHAVGGGAVVGMRQYEPSELQGFFPEEFDVDGNLQGMRMLRYAGFGVLNRIACVVMYIGGGAYAIPTGYTNPLAV